MNVHTILFLAANPSGTDQRALDREARAIQVELERSGQRERFAFVTRWAAQPLDLLRELRKLQPTVVHFCGTSPGLCFQDEAGRPQLVSAAALAQTFGAAGASVKLVVLSACHSDEQAVALAPHVDHVVGIRGSIQATAARSFAIGFYGGLGERASVGAAYLQGRAAMSLEGAAGEALVQLYHRRDVDPASSTLTDVVTSIADLAQLDTSTIQKHVASCTRVLQAEPGDRDALRALGICYLKLGLFDLSDRFIRQLIDRHPSDPSGYYYRAIALLKGKRPRTSALPVIREAEQLVDTALALDPADGRYNVLLAVLRHDYYVVNGMRVPAPAPAELIAGARSKRTDPREVDQLLDLLKINEGPARRMVRS